MNGLPDRWRQSKRRPVPFSLIAVTLILMLVLSGCVYLRLLKFKHQLVKFDEFFRVEVTDRFTLHFLKPMLFAKDFIHLSKFQPSRKHPLPNGERWNYIFYKIDPDGNVVTTFRPKDPCVLPGGLRFGPMDPTLTVLTLCDTDDQAVATLFSVPCHAVAVYSAHRGVSADWPGVACERLAEALGGEAFFLQGCAGDLVPARRGLSARDEMGRFFADRAIAAVGQPYGLLGNALTMMSSNVALPVTPEARAKLACDILPAEVQVLSFGDFALVALPGEPLNGLAREIQARSPFPHTLVIGYANGRSVGYVGLPGEKAKGGYEAGAGSGTEEAGLILIETAVRLLNEVVDSLRGDV